MATPLGPLETLCRSCGATVKTEAVICVSCGARGPAVDPWYRTNLQKGDEAEAAGSAATPEPEPERGRRLTWPVAVAIAAAGCVLGLPAIFLTESPVGVLGPWIWAPVVEELFKPFGVYLLLLKWPGQLRRQEQIAALSAVAGLSFGLLESSLYVFVYAATDAPESYALFRFTIPVAIHTVASLAFGFGFNRNVFRSISAGKGIPKRRWPFLVAAISIHAAYNLAVTVWQLIPLVTAI